MSLDGRAVANLVLDICEAEGRRVTNLALQKIVYFCHVWSLIERKRPLIRHKFEAWQYGPVLQYLYREFKAYDDKPIIGRATKIDPLTGKKQIVRYELDRATEELLRRVINFYSRLNAGDLVKLSHAKGGPWDVAWHHQGNVNPGMHIDDRLIKEFYSRAIPPYYLQ